LILDENAPNNVLVRLGSIVVIALLASCGRIGIDPIAASAIDGSIDADDVGTPRTCVTDGDECDDGNICSSSSHCAEGACVPDSPTAMCRVADSEDDFALVQGSRGWYYGFWHESLDADATYSAADFTPFTIHPGEIWRPADFEEDGPRFTWAYLAVWGGHPAEEPDAKLPIRRWISDVTGAADVAVHLSKADTNGGDGTRAILFVDGVEVFRRDVDGRDGQGFTELVPVELRAGTTVDLMLHYIGNEAVDTSETWMRVQSR
jgi:hypothetical protein